MRDFKTLKIWEKGMDVVDVPMMSSPCCLILSDSV